MSQFKEPVAEFCFVVEIILIELFIAYDICKIRVLILGILHSLGSVVYIALVFVFQVFVIIACPCAGVFIESGKILNLMEEVLCSILILFIKRVFLVLGKALLIFIPDGACGNKACPFRGYLFPALLVVFVEIRRHADIQETYNRIENLGIAVHKHL